MNLAKQRYVDIFTSGIFSQFGPERLEQLHGEVSLFLKQHQDSLDASTLYTIFELQFFLLLLTTRDVEAKLYLNRFQDQFGAALQKFLLYLLMFHEAQGDMDAAEAYLGSDPDQLRLLRRLATFSYSLTAAGSQKSRWPAYIRSLTLYLDLQPADVLAWAELGDLYLAAGHYDKAHFCWKEVLLHEPHAYNAWCSAGAAAYKKHLQGGLARKDVLDSAAWLQKARDSYLRLVDICPHYTRGWLGVYATSAAILADKFTVVKGLKLEALLDSAPKLKALSEARIVANEKLQELGLQAYLEQQTLA